MNFQTLSKLHLVDLGHAPIFEQLQLEEALLRGSSLNFCLLNRGSPRAIVMGISGRPDELIDLEAVKRDRIPLIKRFSGGGTVIVDEETLFITFIFEKGTLPIAPFPEPILRWSGDLYTESWQIPSFKLVENDYTIGPLKCGGNAQYIKKDRWLHHTSFLWDYSEKNMDYLRLPAKRPKYRENRPHTDFLCRLKEHASSKEELIQDLKLHLSQKFSLIEERRQSLIWEPHRQALQYISL
jgi:lipoate-protein ligase A